MAADARKVTIVDVDRRYAGTATLTGEELDDFIKVINDGARIVHLDKRWGVYETYLPVHRIAKVEVESVREWDGE